MVGEPDFCLVEPEVGDLREDFALSGNAVGHNAVEGRNPVSGHEEEGISQVEDFTYLSRFHLGDSGKVEGKDGIRRHSENVVPERGRPKRNMEGASGTCSVDGLAVGSRCLRTAPPLALLPRPPHHALGMSVIANGEAVPTEFPSTIEQFLVRRGLLPRSVVVEHNGDAVAPSEFAERALSPGDRLEIVRIVAGG